jgi:hypothetical protein
MISEIHDLLASPVAALLREGTRKGARFWADADDTLVIEPETAILGSLRRKILDRESEAVEVHHLITRIKDRLAVVLGAMQAADECGARYAVLPNGELAVYTVRAPLPSELWHALHGWRQEIADGLRFLGAPGPVRAEWHRTCPTSSSSTRANWPRSCGPRKA